MSSTSCDHQDSCAACLRQRCRARQITSDLARPLSPPSPCPASPSPSGYMAGSSLETAIVITSDNDDDGAQGSSRKWPIITSDSMVTYAYAYAVEVPPYPSIEDPAGSSKFNPILITVENELEEAELEDDPDERQWILQSSEDPGKDPTYDPISLSDEE